MPEGGNTSTTYTGSSVTFQHDLAGMFNYSIFPIGWSDPALVDPNSLALQSSAVVGNTTVANGANGADGTTQEGVHIIQTQGTIPAVASTQSIYRMIDPANHYATRADVRIDQFGNTDPAGVVTDPNTPGWASANLVGWPMQMSFVYLDGVTDPTHAPAAGIGVSTQTHTWHLFSFTSNVAADIDLGVPVEEGKLYSVETDFDATNGALHGVVTDETTGKVLADKMVFLTDPQYGKYDPSVDGVFNAEAYIESDPAQVFTTDPSLDKPGVAVIDNIDTINRPSGLGFLNYDHGYSNAPLPDSILSNNG